MAHRNKARIAIVLAALGSLLALSPAANAGSLLSTTVAASEAVDRDCTTGELAGAAGVDARRVTGPAFGSITARLEGGAGDWDLAVIDASSGATVAGSAYRGSTEVAQGFVTEGQDLVVQACRRSGSGSTAELSVDSTALDRDVPPASLVNVDAETDADVAELQSLGVDLTEHAGDGFVQVVTYGPKDFETLREAGFSYSVVIEDLAKQSARHRASEEAYADDVQTSALPSGRTTYRRLFDYSEELKQLADDNPDLVQHFTLPHETYEGRPVEGIEITTHPERENGKPVFLQMGLHHAREWPSGEHAMEWAYELVNGYRAGNARVVSLVENTRTIVVPVVNPDGFNISREAGQAQGGGGGTGGDETANIVSSPFEYRRKNCRFFDEASPGGNCAQPSVGLAEPGVDPNRNYGGFWGGPGNSTDPLAQDYRGPGPFSEPETQNIQHLMSGHQVTTMITNHTFSNLVLRPPGVASKGTTPDEGIYGALGDAMAAQNGYASQYGYQLYDTTGTTEDWSYYATGGLGFTFEIGPTNFHPPFQEVVAEYDGTTEAAAGGGGNREAYFIAQENTADPSKHSVIEGQAADGVLLRLQKTFMTPTSRVLNADGEEGERQFFQDHLETTLEVPASGTFEWHVNPSTRPLVARDEGRPANGDPSAPAQFSGGPHPTDAHPCPSFDFDDSTDESCWNDHPFTVPPNGPGVDNEKAVVRIEWATLASDWDLQIFRDTDGDGTSLDAANNPEPRVGQSARGPTDNEQVTLGGADFQPGEYVARVINFAASEPYDGTVTFQGPDEFQPAQTEEWTLTCELPAGNALSTQQVVVARGEVKAVDVGPDCLHAQAAAKAACKTSPTVKGTASEDKLKGTPGSDVIAAKRGNDKVKSGKGDDVICLGRGRDTGGGGPGDDIVLGGGGGDVVKGGGGNDQLFGNRSRDRLKGGGGNDDCNGGPGKDTKQSC